MPPASVNPRRTEVQMHSATARSPQGASRQAKPEAESPNTHVTPTTWLPFLRLAGSRSTPKGVGPEGPLTGCLRGANHAAMSLGPDSALAISTSGLGYERRCGHGYELSVRSHLAYCCGVGRSQVSDHTESRCRKHLFRDSVWSDTWDLLPAGGPGGCGRWAVGGAVEVNVTVTGDRGESKRERNEGGLRLLGGWWSS